NRAYESDPARAQRLLLYGAYPNIRSELRDELVKDASSAATQQELAASDLSQAVGSSDEGHSETNKEAAPPSNDMGAAESEPQEPTGGEDNADSQGPGEQYAAVAPGRRIAGKTG